GGRAGGGCAGSTVRWPAGAGPAAFLPGPPRAAPPADRWLVSRVVVVLYFVAVSLASLRLMGRIARRGGWGVGGLGELRRADVLWGAGNLLALLVVIVLGWVDETRPQPALWIALVVAILGLAQTGPLAVRFRAEGARVFIATLALVATTVAAYAGARAVTPGGGFERELLALGAVFTVLVPGQVWIRRGVDWVFFRRSRRQHAELQAILK